MEFKKLSLLLAIFVFAFGIPEISEARTVYGDLEVVTDDKQNIVLIEGDTITIADGTDTVVLSRSDTYFNFGGAPLKGVNWEDSLLPDLDADLLDGVEGDSFLRSDKIDTYEVSKLNLNNTEISGIDWYASTSGDGSGLDADFVDGEESNYFATTSNATATRKAEEAAQADNSDKLDSNEGDSYLRSDVGDTFTGNVFGLGTARLSSVGSTYCLSEGDTYFIGGDGNCYAQGSGSGGGDGYLPDDPATSDVDMSEYNVVNASQYRAHARQGRFGDISIGGSPTQIRTGIRNESNNEMWFYNTSDYSFIFSKSGYNVRDGWLVAGKYQATENFELFYNADYTDPSNPSVSFRPSTYDEPLGFMLNSEDQVVWVSRESTDAGASAETTNLVKRLDSMQIPLASISDNDTASVIRHLPSNKNMELKRLGIQTDAGDTVTGLKAEVVDGNGNILAQTEAKGVTASDTLLSDSDATLRINNDSGGAQDASAFLEFFYVHD